MYYSRVKGFKCFSPPVMLATFTIEIILVVYTVFRYKLTPATRLITATLFFLGLFQLCEYFVCTGPVIGSANWSRVGYVAISTLPPLGLHLLHVLVGKSKRRLVVTAYVTMLACFAYFLWYRHAFQGYVCTGNYVIFQLGYLPEVAYGTYYYFWLGAALLLAARWANEFKRQGKRSLAKMHSCQAMIVGYLIFLIPTALANSVKPETRSGIPSIMCGFAVLFALILTLYVLPLQKSVRKKH